MSEGMGDLLGILIAIVVVLCFCVYIAIWLRDEARAAERKRLKVYEDYQRPQDESLLAAGHSETYVEKSRQVRELQEQVKTHNMGLWFAWIASAVCLFVFPPLGLVFAGLCAISSIREAKKAGRAKAAALAQIQAIQGEMPEK